MKLLSLWLAWRAARRITAVVVIAGAVALLAHGYEYDARRGNPTLTQLRHAVQPPEHQLERTIKRAFKQ